MQSDMPLTQIKAADAVAILRRLILLVSALPAVPPVLKLAIYNQPARIDIKSRSCRWGAWLGVVTKLTGAAMNSERHLRGVQALYELPEEKVTPEEVSALADQVLLAGRFVAFVATATSNCQYQQGKGVRRLLGPAAVSSKGICRLSKRSTIFLPCHHTLLQCDWLRRQWSSPGG